MDKTTIFIWFSCLLVGIDSAVYLALQNEIPEKPGQCYDRNRTKFYEKGQAMEKEPEEKICGRKKCLGKSEQEGKVLTEWVTCGTFDKKTPQKKVKICNVTHDPRPYPDCCEPYENLATQEFCDSLSSSSNSDTSDNRL